MTDSEIKWTDSEIKWLRIRLDKLEHENAQLRAAVRDAAQLIDNDLVGTWAWAHALEEIIA